MIIYLPIYLHKNIGLAWSQISIILIIMLLPYLSSVKLGKLADSKYGEKELMMIGFVIASITTAGTNYIRYSSMDRANNLELAKSVMINAKQATQRDPTSTVSSFSWNFRACLTSAYTLPVSITLSCSDTESGCFSTKYCLDNSNTCSPTLAYNPVSKPSITTAGVNYIRYFSIDSDNNDLWWRG